MADEIHDGSLEELIEQWRSCLRCPPAVAAAEVTKLERRLRAEIADLTRAGLANEEAFLVAVKRMGCVDPRSREFARERADRVWQQLIPAEAGASPDISYSIHPRRGTRSAQSTDPEDTESDTLSALCSPGPGSVPSVAKNSAT
jgi:hypothetical protein